MIYGQIATSIIAYYMNSYYTGKLLSYPVMEQLKDFIPSLGLALVMGIGVYLIGHLPFPNDLVLLTAQVVTGIILYGSLCNLAKLSSFLEIRFMVQSKLQFLYHWGGNS